MKEVIRFMCMPIGIVLAIIFAIVVQAIDTVAVLFVCLNKLFRYIYIRLTRLTNIDDDEWVSDGTKKINRMQNKEWKKVIDILYPNEFEL